MCSRKVLDHFWEVWLSGENATIDTGQYPVPFVACSLQYLTEQRIARIEEIFGERHWVVVTYVEPLFVDVLI